MNLKELLLIIYLLVFKNMGIPVYEGITCLFKNNEHVYM